MSMFEHFVADCAIRHQAAIRIARGLDGVLTGRTAAEAELSKKTIALIEKLHSLEKLVQEFGAEEVFGPRKQPVSEAELAATRLP